MRVRRITAGLFALLAAAVLVGAGIQGAAASHGSVVAMNKAELVG
ncbi:hypothetical protein AB0P12_01330 [Streptomyces subrutilus]|uniref:Uncharacterized protein n=1 Tax=Streptomyces subrutilus TaxID=36818 RepID=A0A918QL40_9ACTN|nr:hypothetical protein [Streptomyces subrutilus]WSJ32810.1 hypothetical protein OG479_27910 [Streptomyces subrutilus]GGZ56626.1 hypothetical protein GCM10010371_15180 [Streptomyces subrutilus]